MPLVRLHLLRRAGLLHAGVAAHARQRQYHGLIEQHEALGLFDGALCGVRVVKGNKSLALGAQVRLGDNVDNGAELREDGVEGVAQRLRLDALLEVAHVYPGSRNSTS